MRTELPQKWAIEQKYQEACDYFKQFDHTQDANINHIFQYLIMNQGTSYIGNNINYLNAHNYQILTIEEFRRLVLKQNANITIMNVTKSKLKSILGKGGCSEFDDAIKDILKENYLKDDTELVEIPQKYIDQKHRCSTGQLDLLKSIGIEFSSNFKTQTINDEFYFYIDRKKDTGFTQSRGTAISPRLKMYTYENEQTAQNEAKILSLIMAIRNWARHYNEIDNFTPNYKSNNDEYHYLLKIFQNRIVIDWYSEHNIGFANVCFKTKERAQQLLNEFKEELDEIIPLL